MNKNISAIFLAVLSVFVMTGCLKDKGYDDLSSQSIRNGLPASQKVVFMALTIADSSNVSVLALNATTAPITIDYVPITIAGGQPADQDVHITIDTSDALVNDYNTLNPSNPFVTATPGSYTIVNKVVTILKGQYTGFLQIKLTPSAFLGPTTGIGFKIKSVDGGYAIASGGRNYGIAGLAIKNKYDGLYSIKIRTTGWAAYNIADGLTFTYPQDIGFLTSGANTNTLSTTSQIAFNPAGGPIGFGATQPQFQFDPVTDKLFSVVNLAPDDGRGRAFQINSAITDSRFDPATKNIYMAYKMFQNGRPTQFFYDTLTYIGPR